MTVQTYYKILLMILFQQSTITAFSLVDFFATNGKEVLINSAAQYGGYVASKAVGNNLTFSILMPVIANSKLATQFMQISHGMPGQVERVATVAFVFSTAGLLTRTADIPTNASMEAVIAAFAECMASAINNGNNVPFAHLKPNRRRIRLNCKQQVQMEIMIISGIIIISIITWGINYSLKKSFAYVSKIKLNKSRNIIQKFKIRFKSKIQKMRIFKSKTKVKFIPIQ